MAQYRKKPVVVEATKWDGPGDHEAVLSRISVFDRGFELCSHCGRALFDHGHIKTLEGEHIVCPGDWVITGVAGELYPCKPEIFEATYEPVEANTPGVPNDEEKELAAVGGGTYVQAVKRHRGRTGASLAAAVNALKPYRDGEKKPLTHA